MYYIRIEIPRGINVTQKHWECLGGAVLLGAHIGGSKAISTWHCGAHVDRVRYLKVIAQSLVQHDLGALKGDGLNICRGQEERKRERERGETGVSASQRKRGSGSERESGCVH